MMESTDKCKIHKDGKADNIGSETYCEFVGRDRGFNVTLEGDLQNNKDTLTSTAIPRKRTDGNIRDDKTIYYGDPLGITYKIDLK